MSATRNRNSRPPSARWSSSTSAEPARRRLGRQILRGAKPAYLRVEQPTRFDLVVVDRAAKAAGFDNLHPHCLRHSCGYALADKGVGLRTIQEWLGHRSIEMTVRYTRISQRRFNGLWR